MTEDVDEAGWQYALKFHGAVWHGNYKHFRSFVRRRRWIRLRHRRIATTAEHMEQTERDTTEQSFTLIDVEDDVQQKAEHTDKDDSILAKLNACRLDRERMSVLNAAIKSTLPGLEDQLLERVKSNVYFMTYFSVIKDIFCRLLNIWPCLIMMIPNTNSCLNYSCKNTTNQHNNWI